MSRPSRRRRAGRTTSAALVTTLFLTPCRPDGPNFDYAYEATPVLCDLIAAEVQPCEPGEFGCIRLLCALPTPADCDQAPSIYVNESDAFRIGLRYCDSLDLDWALGFETCADAGSYIHVDVPKCYSIEPYRPGCG